MITPETFLQWLRSAISFVGQAYFVESERVYCYELYHYIRVAMHKHEPQAEVYNKVFLHSELVKTVLTPGRALEIGVYPLDSQRSPDFLLHEPNTIDHQIAAMEVKTDGLEYQSFKADLIKLSQLSQRYHFQLSVFHFINADLERATNLIQRAVKDGLNPDNLDLDIQMISKPRYRVDIQQATLRTLL